MTSYKFRPGGKEKWHRRYRLTSFPTVYNIGSHLHYLAQHAPRPIRHRWQPAYRRFCEHYRHF